MRLGDAHIGEYQDCDILLYDTMQSERCLSMFSRYLHLQGKKEAAGSFNILA
jgi:hypothetical protein